MSRFITKADNTSDTSLTKKQTSFFKNIKIIIDETSQQYDKLWRKRNRKIDSKFLLHFILGILSHKDKGYAIIINKLWDSYLLKDIPPPQERTFSQSSVCEARKKLSEDIFKDLNKNLIIEFEKNKNNSIFMENHRIFAVDGSKVTLPKNLENGDYKVNNEGAHYPKGLLSCIYNLQNHVVHDFCLKSSLNERTPALEHMDTLRKNDIVIYDRGYFSYYMLYQCFEKEIHPIFRLQRGLNNKAIDDFIDSDQTDKIIEYRTSDFIKYSLRKKGMNIKIIPITIRLIKYFIKDELYIIATTLLDQEKYKTSLFKELYHKRWDIEELYKISKVILDLENFHSKTDRGVKQEIYAHFVLINIARFFEMVSNNNHSIGKRYKFNFKNSLETIKSYIEELLFAPIKHFLKKIPLIFASITRIKQKIRPNRCYPRVSLGRINKWKLDKKTKREVVV